MATPKTIRIQCRLDDAAWACIDALELTPPGTRMPRAKRRALAIHVLLMRGLEALEAARDAKPVRAHLELDADIDPKDMPVTMPRVVGLLESTAIGT